MKTLKTLLLGSAVTIASTATSFGAFFSETQSINLTLGDDGSLTFSGFVLPVGEQVLYYSVEVTTNITNFSADFRDDSPNSGGLVSVEGGEAQVVVDEGTGLPNIFPFPPGVFLTEAGSSVTPFVADTSTIIATQPGSINSDEQRNKLTKGEQYTLKFVPRGRGTTSKFD
ncbi:MAG: hypothetical protein ACPGO7_04290, partial [Alphaproteobacteria bacterium]